jgi:DNA polymerase III epsilon subunit-like protein
LLWGGILDEFIKDYEDCSLLVAHNIDFDHPVLGAEMVRYKKRASKNLPRFCTMKTTSNICKISVPGRGGYKWPKLEELFDYLFQEGFEGAHDAGNDVTACRLAFFELRKRGLVNIEI